MLWSETQAQLGTSIWCFDVQHLWLCRGISQIGLTGEGDQQVDHHPLQMPVIENVQILFYLESFEMTVVLIRCLSLCSLENNRPIQSPEIKAHILGHYKRLGIWGVALTELSDFSRIGDFWSPVTKSYLLH